jgi:hypothetical protein
LGAWHIFTRRYGPAVTGVEHVYDNIVVAVAARPFQARRARDDVVRLIAAQGVVRHGVAPMCGDDGCAGPREIG